MNTTDSRQPVDSAIPGAGGHGMGFAGFSEARKRLSWQTLAAVYASVPLAIVAFLWLSREGHVGTTSLPVMILILVITSVFNLLAFAWLRTHPGPGLQLQVRLAVAALSTTAVVYSAGWGSMFVIGYAVGAAEIVRSNGSTTWRGALGWNAAAILAGELAIQLHLAPSVLPLAVAHEVALLGFCCFAVVTRVLVLTGRTAEMAEAELRERSHHFESLVAHASDVIGVVDETGGIVFVSPAVETLLGYEPAELEGTPLADVLDPDDVEAVRQLLVDLAATPGTMVLRDVRFRHRNGNERRVVMTFTSRDASGAGTVVINLHDVTVERALEERLRFDAMHDPLTGTWNRAAFTEAMEMACSSSARDGGTVALLFVDIDHFKFVNDTHGHDRGDQLLKNVAEVDPGLPARRRHPRPVGRRRVRRAAGPRAGPGRGDRRRRPDPGRARAGRREFRGQPHDRQHRDRDRHQRRALGRHPLPAGRRGHVRGQARRTGPLGAQPLRVGDLTPKTRQTPAPEFPQAFTC